MYRLTLAQRNPRVNGCSGSPATRTALPDSTVTSIAHASGQSCGQAPRTIWLIDGSYDACPRSAIRCLRPVASEEWVAINVSRETDNWKAEPSNEQPNARRELGQALPHLTR